jgi:hypothetical protein
MRCGPDPARSPEAGDAASRAGGPRSTTATRSGGHRTKRYEIRIRGDLGDGIVAALEGFTVEERPVETVLHGDVPDQAALHGVLERIESLGIELIEVRRLP